MHATNTQKKLLHFWKIYVLICQAHFVSNCIVPWPLNVFHKLLNYNALNYENTESMLKKALYLALKYHAEDNGTERSCEVSMIFKGKGSIYEFLPYSLLYYLIFRHSFALAHFISNTSFMLYSVATDLCSLKQKKNLLLQQRTWILERLMMPTVHSFCLWQCSLPLGFKSLQSIQDLPKVMQE